MAGESTRKLQIGLEGTPGTPVAATVLWDGPANIIKDDTTWKQKKAHLGLLGPAPHTYKSQVAASYKMPKTEVTFEQAPYPLACGIKNVVTGVADGAGAGKIYAYPLPYTGTANTIKTATLEGGDANRAEKMEYAFVESFKISGAAGEPLMWDACVWQGRQCASVTFAVLSPTVPEEVQFEGGKLYIDASGGTIGTTQKTLTWLGFELGGPTGWIARHTGDGNLYFAQPIFIGHAAKPLTGKLIIEHDATATSLIAGVRAQSVYLLRMKFEGSTITQGTAYGKKTFIVDAAVQFNEVPDLSAQDGNDTVELPFTCKVSAADNLHAAITVVNTTASL